MLDVPTDLDCSLEYCVDGMLWVLDTTADATATKYNFLAALRGLRLRAFLGTCASREGSLGDMDKGLH